MLRWIQETRPICCLMKLLTTFLPCAGRTESQIPLAHESDFRSRTWRMVRQHSLCETGPYLTPTISSSFDPGNLNLSFRGSLQRPDCIGNVANAATGNMFNIAAFNPIPEGQREIAEWESRRGLAPLRSRLGCPKLSISRSGCRCALKARSQMYSIIRTSRHRQRT